MNRFIDTDPHTWLLHHVENIIKQRCSNRIQRIDLLQSMIEATDVFRKRSSVSLFVCFLLIIMVFFLVIITIITKILFKSR
jgi:hypothetical protein